VKVHSTANPASLYSDIELARAVMGVDCTEDSYVTVENFDIRYAGRHGVFCNGNTNQDALRFVTIRGCDISFIGGSLFVDNNPTPDAPTRYGNGVEIINSVFPTNAEGRPGEVLVEGCRIWEVQDSGVTNQVNQTGITQGTIAIKNNVIWNCDQGYEVFVRSGSTVQYTYVTNNTFVNAGRGQLHAQRDPIWGRNASIGNTGTVWSMELKGNIFADPLEYNVYVGDFNNAAATLHLDYNLYYSGQPADVKVYYQDQDYSSLSQYQSQKSQDGHARYGDPQFVNESAFDFHLLAGSAAIDVSDDSDPDWMNYYDYDHTIRPQCVAPDMGAFEYHAPYLSLVNVDFNTTTSPTFSGSGVIGGGFWNDVHVSDAIVSNLTDANGNTTTIDVRLSASAISSWDNQTGGNGPANDLLRDYAWTNSESIVVYLTDLFPNATYEVAVYAAGDQTNQGAAISGDISGTTSAMQRSSFAFGTNYIVDRAVADSTGNLSFVLAPNGSSYAVINGLQLGMVAPSTLVNLDFNTGTSPTFSDSGVLGGGLWNGVPISGNSTSYSNVIDARNVPTSIDITISSPFYMSANNDNEDGSVNTLLSDYGSAGDYTSIVVSLSGLSPYAAYAIAVYAAGLPYSWLAGVKNYSFPQGASISGDIHGDTIAAYRSSYAEGVNYILDTGIADENGVLEFTLEENGSWFIPINGLQIAGRIDEMEGGLMMAASTLENVTINDGSAQRSTVNGLTVTLDRDVVVESDAMTVANQADNHLAAVLLSSTLVDGKTVVTVRFGNSSLADGNYVLTIDGNKVRDRETGARLDGDGDGVAGGNYAFGTRAADKFFRLYGDADGDRDVDALDFARFRTAIGKRTEDVGFLGYFDFDGDGDNDAMDFASFRARMGATMSM
jgi:hypothetical protein